VTDLRASAELSTGEILDDRYVLHERIGEGGMARVYRAEDTHLQRSVAVKVFREPTDGIDSVERALSETTLLASLSHHSLVTVFDARVGAGETSYLVMEHVDGITLRDLIARGPVDPKVVASIAIDIAEGLHVAHEHGVVHRDIKPSNVLLWASPRPGWEWRAKLADFGIAYLMDTARVTTPGVIVGTMAYVAPEQARGVPPAPTEEAPVTQSEDAPVEDAPAIVPAEQAPAVDVPPADTGGGENVNDNSGPGNNNGNGGGRGNGNGRGND